MQKKLLDSEYNSIINTYWYWADQFLMIRNINNSKYWILNKFINIKFDRNWFPGGIYFVNNDYRNKMVEFYDFT